MLHGRASKPDLVDCIYAALHGDGSWTGFLDASRRLLPNSRSLMFFHDKASARGAASLTSGFDPAWIETFNAYYNTVNPWMNHVDRRALRQVTASHQLLPVEELKRTEFYADWLRPQSIENGIGVTLRRDDTTSFFLSILCDQSPDGCRSAAAELQALVPHLMRAYEFAQRQAVPNARPYAGTIRIGRGMKVSAMDACAEEILATAEGLAVGAFGRLFCTDPRVEAFVETTLAGWPEIPHPAVMRLHLRQSQGALPLRLDLYCPGLSGMNFFARPEVFLIVENPGLSLAAAIAEFCQMHRLTQAESAIVEGLANGKSLDEIAAARKASRHTVRVQLRCILAKSGCRRQADILRHLGSMVG
jgi:DNA-binding CsgD family transcriptional regulator